MINTFGTYGIKDGYNAGRSRLQTISDNNLHFIGCVPAGRRGQLMLANDGIGGADVNVVVGSRTSPKWDSTLGDWGRVVNTAPSALNPIEFYDPNGGAIPVYVAKAVGGSANFRAALIVVDALKEPDKEYPLLVDTQGNYLGAGSEAADVTITKPSGLLQNDLMLAWVGVADSAVTVSVNKMPADVADAGWVLMGDLGTRNPRIRCWYKLATNEDQVTNTGYKFIASSGTWKWGGQIQCFRQYGASSLSDYGLGFFGTLGFPAIWNGSAAGGKTGASTTRALVEGLNAQIATCNADTTHGPWLPRICSCCFAAGDSTYPTVAPQFIMSRDVGTDFTALDVSAGECKQANVMVAAAGVPLLYPAAGKLQLTSWAYFNSTPYNYQAGYVVLGIFS